MLTKSVDMVNKQLASQAAAIKSLEDKKVKDNQRPDGNRGKSPYRKPAEQGGMRPPPPTCTYCNKLGHTEKQCFAKRDDAKDVPPKAQGATAFKTAVVPKVVPQLRHEAFMTMASIAEERGGETSKPFSYKSSELVTITEGIEAVQSSVEVVAISKMDDIGKKAELPCLSESSELLSLNAIPDCEFDLSTPVRYLGLCCGASMEIIRSLVLGGRYFAEMYLCDLDPLARRVALDALQQMVSRHPKNFSAPLRQDIKSGRVFEIISQDVRKLNTADVITLSGVNLVIASPDCQPFSAAGKQLGFEDMRSLSFVHCLRIIWEIFNMVHQPITYVIENVPGAGRFKSIIDALGLPLLVSAHRLGSSARRETLLWTNSHTREFLQSHLTASQVPVVSVGEFLTLHGFNKEWTAPEGLSSKVFPKFLSRIGSHAYRMHDMVPGSGMLLYNGT
jgi:hypothetical protein